MNDTRCHLAKISAEDPIYDTLFAALFSTAISIRDWPQAYKAALEYPIADKKLEKYHRLVTAMLDAGELEGLLRMCSELRQNNNEIQNVVDFSEVTSEVLSTMSMRHPYAGFPGGSEPLPDYVGALFALHVLLGRWKKASETMDLRYVHGRDALAERVSGLNQDQQ
jgi:hypothetical protein